LDALAADTSTASRVQLALWKGDAALLPQEDKPEVALGRAVLGGETGNPLLRGCHLLLAGKFADAVAPLEQARDTTRPDQSSHIPTLLAWAYLETGRAKDAAELLRIRPIPRSGAGVDAFLEFLAFPRVLELRKRAGG
jgi:hypothetical protein